MKALYRLKSYILGQKIRPGGLAFNLMFRLARLLHHLGLLSTSEKVDVQIINGVEIVLTPLAGSSSLRHLNRQASDEPTDGSYKKKSAYIILSANEGKRAQSFYNKKVRNPTNLGKVMLLACCPPLNYSSSVDEFLHWLECCKDVKKRDKHLWPIRYVKQKVERIKGYSFEPFSLETDRLQIEALLDLSLEQRVNTSKSVAIFQEPIAFSSEQLLRASIAMEGR